MEVSVEEVRFVVKKIIYRNKESRYTIAQVDFKKHNNKINVFKGDIIKGYFVSIFKGDEYIGVGKWTRNEKYGYQLELANYKKVLPVTEKGLIEFLSRNVEGIGEKTARKIVETYKENSISKIKESPKNLEKIKGIGKVKAERIHRTILRHENFEETMLFFMQNGIHYKIALDIYNIFKEDTLYRIKENPFIISNIDNTKFYDADKIAKNLGLPYNNINRLKSFVLFFLTDRLNKNGDIFVYEEELLNLFDKDLLDKGAYSLNEKKTIKKPYISKILELLLNEKKIARDFNKQGNSCIYLYRYHYMEDKIVDKISTFVKTKSKPICSNLEINSILKKYEKNNNVKLAQKQKEAIYMFNDNKISILTGGPGTGKTQIIKAIVEIIYETNPYATIELVAPTGKASKKMSEVTGLEAKTIHRLINLQPNKKNSEVKNIECDYLVIDESSMIDIYIFYKLLMALQNHTKVLLVGDYDQLPSVGAGLILRDLINSKVIPTTRLTEIFRQKNDSQIISFSNTLIKGEKIDIDNINNKKGDFYFIQRNNVFEIQRVILYSIKRFLEKGYSMDEIQVLTCMKKGEIGTNRLNGLIQNVFNKQNKKNDFYALNNGSVFKIGDKVMQNINNYDLEVFNGYVGTIVDIENSTDDVEVIVDYKDCLVKYDYTNIEELDLAYSITIHKSQGSEFPIIIIPIHSNQSVMLNRNLIYTAITRAKNTVIMIGEKEALDYATIREDNTKRNSLIKDKLCQFM